jgi:hypothetical protein
MAGPFNNPSAPTTMPCSPVASPRRVGRMLTAACLVLPACRAPRPVPSGAEQVVLVAPAATLETGHVRTRSTSEQVLLLATPQDSVARPAFTVQHEERLVSENGVPSLLMVTTYSPPIRLVDSLLMARDGLVPRWEHLHMEKKALHLAWNGITITTTATAPDSAPRTTQRHFDATPFGFNQLELIVRSLPFRAGYHRVVALYSEGSGELEHDTLDVISRGAPSAPGDGGVRSTWMIRFADPAIVTVYQVDPASRQILSAETTQRQGGRRFRRVLLDPSE